uniref:Myb/SANT-like DNA-binding domain-containing protein n=1 Tax=Oreochromis niloticus TaxID=8128 RepID=I3KP93_ORENI
WASSPTNVRIIDHEDDTRRLIELRAANESLFTGRRNTAKPAWRAILKELGLQGKVSTYQMAKKWDNLKRRYKDLKYPPVGMESVADGASSWPWFHLMNEAMEGRLASSAPLLTPVTQDDDQHPDPAPRHRLRAAPAPPPAPPASHPSSSDYAPDAFGDGAEQNQRSSETCDGPLGGLEREWEMVERERAALEREREMVERDRAALERERAAVQAERLWLDRERVAVERDRAMVEQDRAALGREREVLDQRALMLNSVGHAGQSEAGVLFLCL